MTQPPPNLRNTPSPTRLLLFGPPKIDFNGTSLVLSFERRNQVLAVLALKRTWVGRAELAALLWPEQETKLAYTNLRKALHRLQSLPWAPALELQGSAVRFDADTDVAAFEAALREERIAEALALRSGELLTGFDDDANDAWSGWLHFERDRLRAAWRGAALSRLDSELDAAEAIDLSARLLEDDPLDEAALRVHMTWLAQAGQSARARQAYREFIDRLQKDLGLAPSAELKALHDTLGTTGVAAAASAASVASASSASGASSARDDDFIGRSIELRRIASLLAQDDCRLLSLIGPGGMGKTRLARRALHELAPGYADGAAFVPLEDASTASDLVARLARDLGLKTGGSAEPLAQVTDFLRERQMLLVLDNVEQLAADAPVLSRLLTACPRTKVIATSRVRLAIALEWLSPLEGLPCPEAEDRDHVESFDAARLFIRAARRMQPEFDAAANAAAIVDICAQVEGLPLALELAAAWTRVLPCEAIAAELRHGTELLRATDAAHPDRHASIEVVFDQSWRLLGAAEREALACLSIFRGGFTAEAARAVAGASLAVLAALADKSLVRRDGARLALHPLVQQFAAARLGDGAAHAATQAAHATYFDHWLAQLESAVDAGDRAALQSIDAELDNCRLTWQWSIAHGKLDAIRRIASILHRHFDHRGRFREGLALLRDGVDAPPVQADAVMHAMFLGDMSHFEYRLDRYAAAEAMAARALSVLGRRRDLAIRLRAVSVLAACALRLGRLDDARRRYQDALALATEIGDQHQIAGALDHLALVEKRHGHFDDALRLSLESLTQHRRIGHGPGVALCLNNLASLYLARQQPEAAAPHLREALAICERDGLAGTLGYVLANLTDLAMKTGDVDAAAAHAQRGLEVTEAIGNRAAHTWMQIEIARVAVRRGDLAAARTALAAGLKAALALGLPALNAVALMCFAELLHAQGEGMAARRLLAFAADHPSTSAADSAELRDQLALWGAPVAAPAGIELGEMLNRIVAETGIAHAPLIAVLRGAQ